MTDKPLRVQVFEYLINNNGREDFVDIKSPFLNPSSDIKERSKYISVIDKLLNDKHIEVGDTGYGIIGCLDAGRLRPIDHIKINARLTPVGESYLRDLVNPTPMNYTYNRNIINVSENNGIIQHGNDYQSTKIKSQITSPTSHPATNSTKSIIKYVVGILGTLLAAYISYKMGWG
jgi:hypothetical protein